MTTWTDRFRCWSALVALLSCSSCTTSGHRGEPAQPTPTPSPSAPSPLREVEVEHIALSGPLAERKAELSGLAWFGDHLILLPQYPDRFESRADGLLFAIPRARLVAWAKGQQRDAAIAAQPIELVAPGLLTGDIAGMQGFEAIGFAGNTAFLTIEAGIDGRMTGYLVSGTMASDLSALTLDVTNLATIPPQTPTLSNAAEEALLVVGDQVLTFYEANGQNSNPSAQAHVFDRALQRAGTIAMPVVEYRITDATAIDENGHFWLYNGFYPGDRPRYQPAADGVFGRYRRGPSHARSEVVERILPMVYRDGVIRLRERPPIAFRVGDESRNWEGLVRLGEHGFLVASDWFPATILGFVRAD